MGAKLKGTECDMFVNPVADKSGKLMGSILDIPTLFILEIPSVALYSVRSLKFEEAVRYWLRFVNHLVQMF